MARRLVVLLLALALTGCGTTAEPLPRAEDTPPNPIVDQVVEWLRAQGNEEPSPEDIVGTLNRKTAAVYQEGDYAGAEALAEVARDYAERVLGPEHPQTLTSVNDLALLYQAQGRYGEAEPLCQRALAARERVLGPEHPDTLTSVNSLAALYLAQGRYGEAEPLYQRALAARERVLGPEHPDTLTVQMNLAIVLINQDKHRAALRQLRRLDARLRAFVGLQLATTEKGVVSRNPRKFRQPNSSPATIASRSIICPPPRKV